VGQKLNTSRGFTLIELMVAVAIIAVLAAVAIPVYQNYVRRSYVAEAQSAIAQIKGAAEAHYSLHREYISTDYNPGTSNSTSIPAGSTLTWDNCRTGWNSVGLNMRPDRFVRFQYKVWGTAAAQSPDGGPCDAAPAGTGGCGESGACLSGAANNSISAFQSNTGADRCYIGSVGSDGLFVDTDYQGSDWYVIGARGNLNPSSDLWTSLFSAVDESRIFECNLGE